MQTLTRTASILPVIKANAYGHDPLVVMRALRGEKTWGFGVAHGDEALALREVGARSKLLVLSGWKPAEVKELLKSNTELVAWDWPSLNFLLSQPSRRPFIHLKLDSGTTRIGFLPADITPLKSRINHNQKIAGVFSHFANAEEDRSRRTKTQLNHFTTLQSSLDHPKGIRHIACTAAIIRYPEAHFGLVRLGIGLYGLWPSNEIKAWASQHRPGLTLQPALRWYATLTQVKEVPAGTRVGYGSTFRAKNKTRIGILPVGYFDGLDRSLSNGGRLSLRGTIKPIVGRVCMNLTMIDLGKMKARPGEPIEIIGPHVSADDHAKKAQTISYEILSRIHPNLPRRLI